MGLEDHLKGEHLNLGTRFVILSQKRISGQVEVRDQKVLLAEESKGQT
jgi:hypothetical protein